MDLMFKKVRNAYQWWYPAPVHGEKTRRAGVVARDPVRSEWWACVDGVHDGKPKGWGSSRPKAIEDVELIVFGNTAAHETRGS